MLAACGPGHLGSEHQLIAADQWQISSSISFMLWDFLVVFSLASDFFGGVWGFVGFWGFVFEGFCSCLGGGIVSFLFVWGFCFAGLFFLPLRWQMSSPGLWAFSALLQVLGAGTEHIHINFPSGLSHLAEVPPRPPAPEPMLVPCEPSAAA